MDEIRSQRAQEILDTAMALFSEHGYEATSVAEIQVAAGMTPGSGALYKHFPSKQALLEAGIGRFVTEGRSATSETPDVDGADLRAALREFGTTALKVLAHDRAALRVAWRDLPAFPNLNRMFVEERLQPGFRRMSSWLEELAAAHGFRVTDPNAMAAVLLGSLAFFRVMDHLVGEKPLRLGDSRFLDAWVEVAVSALEAQGDDGGRTRSTGRTRRR